MRKFKKPLIFILSAVVTIVIVAILFISPISKYLVEKYDQKYMGRQITMDWAYVNPFTGYIHFSDLKIYESKTDSVFFSARSVNANFSMRKLLSKTYEITELEINQPKGNIIQNGNNRDLNFNDIIKRFSPKKGHKVKSPVHFSIRSIKINDGEFHYSENITPVTYFIKKVNIESSGIYWNSDTISLKFSFLSGIGNGDMNGNFMVNSKNKDYRFAVVVNKFDLQLLEQYMKDMSNYGNFSANLDADIKASGNFDDKENVIAKGMLAINHFHFGKSPKDDYASFEKMVVTINELSPKNHKYLFDSISLSHPYFKYERYDYLDNFQTMFGKKGVKIKNADANPEKFNLVIEIARYVKVLANNFFKSNYKINRLAVYNGDLKFSDYSLSEKFSADLSPLFISADSIGRNHKRVNLSLNSGIKPYGNVSLALSINPKDSSDFDIKYHLLKLPASLFNPYIISYTSFPLDRGTIELNGVWNVRNGTIQSNNHLVLIDPRLTTRLKNKATTWIPMRLLLFFIRERGNVIDYEIPITGNLKNPKFNIRDVIFDALENVFVKPATTPYRVQVKNTETEIEKSLSLDWPLRSVSFQSNQEKFTEKIADFLVENPKANITITPSLYELKEKEYILLFEAKKKYFLMIHHRKSLSISESDSEVVNNMSITDSSFVHYITEQVKDPMLFTVQEKCLRLVGPEIVDAKFQVMNTRRENSFTNYFKKRGVERQVKIRTSKNVIPYNGFSFYKIEYQNGFPDYLMEAYQKMNKLNNEPPREKFKQKRERSIGK